jgi:hypothetical protein
MAEQRIVVTIDENGKINASTEGIKGEMCLAELQSLLGELADLESVTKTDEYYQANELSTKKLQERRVQ